MNEAPARAPDWDRLFDTAAAQEGLFTTRQAAEAGYSPQLLAHHVGAGRMVRVRRGVYRLVHFPAGDLEELSALWLWADRAGVFSHQTALALHELSDVLPNKIHMTLPSAWKKRRLRVPDGLRLYFGDVGKGERSWYGPVPATRPARTLNDCADAHLSPDLLRQGARDALHRGLVTLDELSAVEAALEPFGGLAA